MPARPAARAGSGCPRPASLSSSMPAAERAAPARARSGGRARCRRRRATRTAGRSARAPRLDARARCRRRRRARRRSPSPSRASTRPPSGVQRNAFASRFVIICSTRSPSVTIVGCAATSRSVVDLAPPRLLAEASRRPGRRAAPCRPPRACTVNRCASSFARSSTSPTSRSSRIVSPRDDVERRIRALRVVDEPVADRVDVAPDRGQRRAQLVRDRHQEVPLALLGLARAAPPSR